MRPRDHQGDFAYAPPFCQSGSPRYKDSTQCLRPIAALRLRPILGSSVAACIRPLVQTHWHSGTQGTQGTTLSIVGPTAQVGWARSMPMPHSSGCFSLPSSQRQPIAGTSVEGKSVAEMRIVGRITQGAANGHHVTCLTCNRPRLSVQLEPTTKNPRAGPPRFAFFWGLCRS